MLIKEMRSETRGWAHLQFAKSQQWVATGIIYAPCRHFWYKPFPSGGVGFSGGLGPLLQKGVVSGACLSSNTPAAWFTALRGDSPAESHPHQDVLPSTLVEAVHGFQSSSMSGARRWVFAARSWISLPPAPASSPPPHHTFPSSCLHSYVFRKWNNINIQSMCPSSHLLIRCQCKSFSLNSADQRLEAHLYPSWARAPTRYCSKISSHEVRRKAAFLSMALARTTSLPL